MSGLKDTYLLRGRDLMDKHESTDRDVECAGVSDFEQSVDVLLKAATVENMSRQCRFL